MKEKTVYKTEYKSKCTSCSAERYKKEVDAYRKQENKLTAFVTGAIFYGYVVTILGAIQSEQFAIDTGQFFTILGKWIWSFIKEVYSVVCDAGKLAHHVPYPVWGTVLEYVIIIGLCVGSALGAAILIVLFSIKLKDFYRKHYWDKISAMVWLGSLAVLVFFGNKIRMVLPINLFAMIFLIQVVYMVGRTVIVKRKRESMWM